MPLPAASLLSYPAAIPLSIRSLNRLADLIRAHRHQRRSHWCRLGPGRQALFVLAHLRNGDTFARLAAGFEIGMATAWRYVREAITVLAATADDLQAVMTRIRRLAYAILYGALIPIDRVADHKLYYSGNTSGTASTCRPSPHPAGRLVWASAALPGAVHDLTAARANDIVNALASAEVPTLADRGYQGAGGSVRTPFKRHRRRQWLSRREKAVNRFHTRIRALDERTIATLKPDDC